MSRESSQPKTHLKILHIISKGYPHGGAEHIVACSNISLREKGHQVRTLASDLERPGAIQFSEYRFRGLHAFSFLAGVPISRAPWLLQYLVFPAKLLFFLWNFSAFFALKRLLKTYRPDLVHLHTMIQVSPAVLFLLRDTPTVMSVWGPETFLRPLFLWCLTPADFKQPPSGQLYPAYTTENLTLIGRLLFCFFQTLQRPVYQKGLKHVNLFLAPSYYMQALLEREGLACRHLPTFLDPQPWTEVNTTSTLLFVGRLVNVKGVEFLIEAMVHIVKQLPHTKLIIVGDGFGKAALINLTRALQVEFAVQFAGWVPHEDLSAYYQAASLVVIPSLWPENFPTVCSEAMSAGRAVIGTRVGGIPEMIDDGINGYLVEPANAVHIAEKALALLSNLALLQQFGHNARRKAERWSSKEHYVAELEQVYQEIVQCCRERR